MKRKIFIGLGIAALLGAFTLTNCGHPGPGHCFSFHHKMGGKMIRQLERDLNLTDVQKKQVNELKTRIKNDAVVNLQEKQKFLAGVAEKLNGANPNIDEIIGMARTQMKKGYTMMDDKLRYIGEFYGILNADQKRILNQKVREHLAKKQEMLGTIIEHLKEAD